MRSENKRIFISDLPETLTKEELESSFSQYGQVSSVEIKERKELGPNNKSLFFAYINVNTDDGRLNQCFRDLTSAKWHGQYVQLQIARESFLERLKRERQEAEGQLLTTNVHKETNNEVISRKPIETTHVVSNNGFSTPKQYIISSDSDSDIESKPVPVEKSDIIIKSNKNKLHDKNGLRIASVGKAPIAEISLKKPKAQANDSAANVKRLQSLKEMKKGYEAQKSLIKNALTYSANKPINNKIIFDDESSNKAFAEFEHGFKNNSLFAEDNSEDGSDFEANFAVKEQFQGKAGQKLLELQSKYKNDKRFALDERFIEREKDEAEDLLNEDALEIEKNEQFKILEQVLGKKITPNAATKRESASKKIMVKFDPLQPNHAKLQLAVDEPEKKKRKKAKEQELEEPQKPEPEVSKETFYKVPDKLKDTFEEKPQFSLLSLYGKKDDVEDDEKPSNQTAKEIKPNQLKNSQNPFKYDSSDDEDEIGDIPHKNTTTTTVSRGKEIKSSRPARTNQSVFWTEPFFFKSDDFRLQEGFDFIEKIKSENKEFLKIRRELKGIVKAKVKNNERKNKMFKKKLGGSKRRKHVRIKKALKR